MTDAEADMEAYESLFRARRVFDPVRGVDVLAQPLLFVEDGRVYARLTKNDALCALSGSPVLPLRALLIALLRTTPCATPCVHVPKWFFAVWLALTDDTSTLLGYTMHPTSAWDDRVWLEACP